jgi:HEAT repeats/Planctomycete cytochrome C
MNQPPASPNPPVTEAVRADPVIELQQLRDQHALLQGRFFAAGVAFVFLLVVSALQFIGTFVTCQILFAARRDTERAQREATQLLKDVHDGQLPLEKAAAALRDARQTLGQINNFEISVQRLEAQAARLAAVSDGDGRRLELLDHAEAIRDLAERRLREANDVIRGRLLEADLLIEEMRSMKKEHQSQVQPVVDPNHKHPTACPVDQWQGVRGVSSSRQPTEARAEEAKPDPPSMVAIKAELKSKQVPARLEAVSQLARIGPPAASAAPDLIRMLEEDHSASVRAAAVECLGKFKDKARVAIPKLILAMESDEYSKVRAEAATTLAQIGLESIKDGLPAMKAAMKKEKNEAVITALDVAIKDLEKQEVTVDHAVDFEKHVLPILTSRCSECHDAKAMKSGLDVTRLASLKQGGRTGFPAVVLGDLKKSQLWEFINTQQMPPEGSPALTAREIEIIQQWIAGKK